jgi:hypothetical protein
VPARGNRHYVGVESMNVSEVIRALVEEQCESTADMAKAKQRHFDPHS